MIRDTRPKGSSAKPLWSRAPCATLGWAACIKNARAPAVINHCSSCKRQDNEFGPSKPGSGSGSLIGNSLGMGAPLAQWIKRIASRGLCIRIFASTIGVVIAGYDSFYNKVRSGLQVGYSSPGFSIVRSRVYFRNFRLEAMGTIASSLKFLKHTRVLDYGFRFLNLYNIALMTFSFNERAIRAYQKAGFKESGRRRGALLLNGQRYD